MPEEKSHLEKEFVWLLETISWRWKKEFDGQALLVPKVPVFDDKESRYRFIIEEYELSENDRLVFALALAPFFIPFELTSVITASSTYEPASFGARALRNTTVFIPTGATAIFMLGGKNVTSKLEALMEVTSHPLVKKDLILIGKEQVQEPIASGFLSVIDAIYLFLAGKLTFDKLKELTEPTDGNRN